MTEANSMTLSAVTVENSTTATRILAKLIWLEAKILNEEACKCAAPPENDSINENLTHTYQTLNNAEVSVNRLLAMHGYPFPETAEEPAQTVVRVQGRRSDGKFSRKR